MEKIAQFYVGGRIVHQRLEAPRPAAALKRQSRSHANIRLALRHARPKAPQAMTLSAPESFTLVPHETILIPTGIRVMIEDGWVLQLYPRSGLGFRHRLQLDNTVGVIDSDYFEAKNEGHILIKMTSDDLNGKMLSVQSGDAFAQGIFLPYGITVDDDAEGQREGGFGSTTGK